MNFICSMRCKNVPVLSVLNRMVWNRNRKWNLVSELQSEDPKTIVPPGSVVVCVARIIENLTKEAWGTRQTLCGDRADGRLFAHLPVPWAEYFKTYQSIIEKKEPSKSMGTMCNFHEWKSIWHRGRFSHAKLIWMRTGERLQTAGQLQSFWQKSHCNRSKNASARHTHMFICRVSQNEIWPEMKCVFSSIPINPCVVRSFSWS